MSRSPAILAADALEARFQTLLNGTASATGLDPAEARELFEGYRKLNRRLARIARISDNYQGEVKTLVVELQEALVRVQSTETQLTQLNQTLSQQVEEEIERRLRQERMLAQQTKLAAMGQMVGAIAHQWRQPLSTVAMVVQNIRESWRRNRLDQTLLEEAVDLATSQIRFMSETIDVFRNFFQPTKAAAVFSVAAQVHEAAALLRPQLEQEKITLRLPELDARDQVCGFPTEFTQALVNLLTNGHDAIRERRRQLPDLPGILAVTMTCSEQRVSLEIIDNGMGIPHEVAERLFEPYFSTKPAGLGTGIGLYMSRLIIAESMAGEIAFSSSPGRTVFRVELPRNGMPECAAAPLLPRGES